MSRLFKKISVLALTLIILSLTTQVARAASEEADDDSRPVACVYNKGVFRTSSGEEFKGFGAKKKCLELERKDLVEKNCVSGSGSVSNDPQGHFTVECDPVQ